MLIRVGRGAQFLDQQQPGWPLRIDVSELDMSMPNQCILGQLFMSKFQQAFLEEGDHLDSSYSVGLQELEIEVNDPDDRQDVELGFDLPAPVLYMSDEERRAQWSFLAECWVGEIKDRLDKGVQL